MRVFCPYRKAIIHKIELTELEALWRDQEQHVSFIDYETQVKLDLRLNHTLSLKFLVCTKVRVGSFSWFSTFIISGFEHLELHRHQYVSFKPWPAGAVHPLYRRLSAWPWKNRLTWHGWWVICKEDKCIRIKPQRWSFKLSAIHISLFS